MKKARKFRICTYLSAALAVILFAPGAYILVIHYIATRDIDFTWTTNLLMGIAGILLVIANFCNKAAKEHTSLFD